MPIGIIIGGKSPKKPKSSPAHRGLAPVIGVVEGKETDSPAHEASESGKEEVAEHLPVKGGDKVASKVSKSASPPVGEMGGDPQKGAGGSPPLAGKRIRPGTSQFHNQSTTCINCEYFNPAGNEGIGECMMKVPEADFSSSDPYSSWCHFWEDEDEGEGESEGEGEGEVEK